MMAIYMYLLRASQGSYPEKYHKGLIINVSYNCTTEQQYQGAAAEITVKKGRFCPFPTVFYHTFSGLGKREFEKAYH